MKSKNPEQTTELVLLVAKAGIDKKSNHTLIFNVGKLGAFTDFFLITSGSNDRQVQAIADEMTGRAKKAGYKTISVEGYEEGRWVLIDFGSVVVHVFQDFIREYYDLEALWAEAPRVKIPEEYFHSDVESRPSA